MTKKIEGESTKKNGNADVAKVTPLATTRQLLLARVAGDVASGIVSAPSELSSSAESIATIAVDVAEEILKKVGL